MDPVTAAALINAGSQLLGGLAGAKSAAAQAEEERKRREEEQRLQIQQEAIQSRTSGTQSALGNLMEAYRSGLVR